MPGFRARVCAFAAVLAAAGCVRAQEVLLLAPLIEEALRKNPEALAAQKRYEAARQRPDRESSLPDPMLGLGYNSSGVPLPGFGLGREPVANIGMMVSQTIPFPGKRKLRGDIAAVEAKAEWEQYEAVRLNIVSRVKQAYHKLHHAWEMGAILEHTRDLVRTYLRVAEQRYAVGKGEQAELLRMQTQITLLEVRIRKMAQERRAREAELNALLARPLETPLGRPDPPLEQEIRKPLDELLKRLPETAPMLLREEKMVARNELSVNLARKDYYPDYTISAGYYNMGRMPDMYMARVDFQLPGWFFRKQRAGVAEQTHLLSQSKHNYRAAGETLRYRVREDYLMAETSLELARTYKNTAIPQAALALESSFASYSTGAGDFLSLMANFMTLLEYETGYHEEIMNLHMALARLEEMTGVPLLD